jgi:hypothetical protein
VDDEDEDIRRNMLVAMDKTYLQNLSLTGKCLHIVLEFMENGDL